MQEQESEFEEVSPEPMDRVIGNYNPVVIITTKNSQGQSNAAPFAMCMEVCHNPPMMAFGVGRTKDTYHNVKETGEFVINVPGKNLLKKLMITSKGILRGSNKARSLPGARYRSLNLLFFAKRPILRAI